MPMFNPSHPGEIIRDQILSELGISVERAASMLKVQPEELQNILDAKAKVEPDMAVRLEKCFGQPAELWLRLQAAYDLHRARQKMAGIVIEPAFDATVAHA